MCVCLCVSISLEPLDRSSRNSLCRFPVAVARSFSGDVMMHYVLPVLWMTSCLATVGHMAMRGYQGGLMSMNALFENVIRT